MNKVNSLRKGIFSEIIIVMIPLTLLLIYQTVSDIAVSDRLSETFRQQTASTAARHKYKLFINGVVDAVDTGRLAEDAVNELQGAVKDLSTITTGERAREFTDLSAKANELLSQLQKDRSLEGLLPLQENINRIDAELGALDASCEHINRTMIQANIQTAQTRKKIVFAALFLAALVTAGLITQLIRHINRFEEVLRESEERMRVMFESINAGIVLIDCETRTIADINPAALRMYGGSKNELIGRSCINLFHDRNDVLCPIMDEKKSIDISRRNLNLHNGEQLPILKSVNSVTVGGKPYMLESFVDLSEQAALETELLSAKDAAETANRAKSIFLASMSHEIRTPMNAILGYSQLLRREKDLTSQQEKYLDIVNRSGEHLLKLINDILEMSKIEAGTINHTKAHFSFHELLNEIETLFSARTNQKKLTFSIDLNDSVPAVLNADGGKVRQVLINVINNALKFTDRGGIAVTVDAGPGAAGADSVSIIIDVEDSGSGIATEEFDKVFTSFEQTASGRNKIEGTGLGMPISRQFARLMGGDLLLLRSEPGVGSVFRFTFQAEVAGSDVAAMTEAAVRSVRRIAPNEKEWRVLVVDDQDTNRSLLAQVLGQAGFAVREAADGFIGVEQFRVWSPDIVLMDIHMPVMNGYEAMRQIKASAAGAATPVIAITASVMMDERQKALDCGFDGFIMKPVPMEYLFEEIRRLTRVAYLYEVYKQGGGAITDYAVLTTEKLSTLAESLRSEMREALDAGDMAAMRTLIDHVGQSEPELAAALLRLVDSYDYDTLTTLFAKEEPSYVRT
ncbi:MAG: response regulator [Geobacter sp.]|nr:response regulator [Geobacter sp.]